MINLFDFKKQLREQVFNFKTLNTLDIVFFVICPALLQGWFFMALCKSDVTLQNKRFGEHALPEDTSK